MHLCFMLWMPITASGEDSVTKHSSASLRHVHSRQRLRSVREGSASVPDGMCAISWFFIVKLITSRVTVFYDEINHHQ